MRNKVIILCVLLILIVTMGVGTIGVAFADEIKLGIKGETFSAEEKDRAIMNLKDKFEDKDLPTLIDIEEIYDFNGEPLYGLYEFVDYYMIVIRRTSSIMERGECNSVYFGLEGKKYYGGFGNTYILDDKGYKSLNSDKTVYASEEEIEEMKNKMAELRALDYEDYIEALNTPMPLGAGNRTRLTMLGNSSEKFNYFAREVNIYYCWHNLPNADVSHEDYNSVLYTFDGFDPKEYGTVYMRDFNYGYDLFYPKNVYNACSIVSMVMVLQYYDRMRLNTNLIPAGLGCGYTKAQINNNPLLSRAEQVRAILDRYTNVLQIGSSLVDGAATYRDINYGFKDYFEAYGIDCQPTHFTTYTNIKKAVDSGNPAIMTIGSGTGYDINNKPVGLSRHNVVVYGYTKNSLGVLDEFVCHANKHEYIHSSNNQEKTAQLYVSKFCAAGNVYINGI